MSAEDESKGGAAVAVAADMRSDTVTKPTDAMREAMKSAVVGDDVYGDDPTVNELQRVAAEMFGKEAALFVPTGTMGNLISVMTHCRERGSEFIVGDNAHLYYYEQGGSATLGGAHPRPLPNQEDGTIKIDDIEHAIRDHSDAHFPRTALIALENTHNRMGGVVLPLEYTDAVGVLAKKHGIKLHLDGARVFNAAAALGVPVSRIAEPFDSVQFCLSKALGAPSGSMLVGTKEFIHRAHRWRKALGGGMRQVGVLAAPALIAIKETPALLPADHARAKRFATSVAKIEGVTCDVDMVHTNLVMFDVSGTGMAAPDVVGVLAKEHGVLTGAKDEKRIRAAIHHQVDDAAIDAALAAIAAVAAAALAKK